MVEPPPLEGGGSAEREGGGPTTPRSSRRSSFIPRLRPFSSRGGSTTPRGGVAASPRGTGRALTVPTEASVIISGDSDRGSNRSAGAQDMDEAHTPTDEMPSPARRKGFMMPMARDLGNKVVNARRRAVAAVDKKHDEILEAQLSKILAKAGGVAKETAKAPYMPERIVRVVDDLMDKIWSTIDEELKQGIMASYGRANKQYRELRLKQWAKAPPFRRDNIYAWFRAKVLYATQPADATIWKVTQDSVNASIIAVKLIPFFGMNVLIFALIFLFIDRRDEFQLVRFILGFKGFQFISAVMMAAKTGIKTYFCLESGALAHYGTLAGVEAAIATGGDSFSLAKCAPVKPGIYSGYIYSLELLRIALLYSAAHLLESMQAYGGRKELVALEEVRLDIADGQLDGVADRKKVRSAARSTIASGSVDSLIANETHADELIDDDEILEATMAARKKHGVEKKSGGYLPKFMMYDRYVVVIIFSVGLSKMAMEGFLSPDHFMFWTTLFYMKMLYGLLAFPFLIFSVPLLGRGMHGAITTAYDQSGTLVPKLSSSLMKKKKAMDDRERARRRERAIRERQRQRAASRSIKLKEEKKKRYLVPTNLKVSRGGRLPASTASEGGYVRLADEENGMLRKSSQASLSSVALSSISPARLTGMTEKAAAVAIQARIRGRKARGMIARTGAAAAAIGNESGRGCLGCDNKFGRQLRKRWDRLTTAADDCLDSVGEFLGPCMHRTMPCLEALPFHPVARARATEMISELESRGYVKILLVEGVGLRAADKGGTSDPYVLLDLDDRHRRSTIIKKTVSPVWNETFEWNGVLRDLLDDGLILTVYDHDKVSGDDNIGMAHVSLEPLLLAREASFTAELSLQGMIKLKVSWRAAESAAAEFKRSEIASVPSHPVMEPYLLSRGVLRVKIFSAQDLLAADPNGLSDPYVRIVFGAKKATTKVMYETLDPIWNEVFEFEGWMNDLLDFPLKLSVWDKDKGTLNRDDPLGAAQLNLTPLKKKFLMAETLDIVHKSVKRGVLHISVSWSTPQLDRKLFELSRGPSSSLASMSLENKALLEKRGELHIILHSGKGLKAADANGTSDPFVRFELGSADDADGGTSHKLKSKVKKNTLNPVWEESFVIKNVTRKELLEPLRVEAFDSDGRFSASDKLGYSTQDITRLLRNPEHRFVAELSAGGTIEFTARWVSTEQNQSKGLPTTDAAETPSLLPSPRGLKPPPDALELTV